MGWPIHDLYITNKKLHHEFSWCSHGHVKRSKKRGEKRRCWHMQAKKKMLAHASIYFAYLYFCLHVPTSYLFCLPVDYLYFLSSKRFSFRFLHFQTLISKSTEDQSLNKLACIPYWTKMWIEGLHIHTKP